MNTEQLHTLRAEFALVFDRYRQTETDNFDSKRALLEQMLRIVSQARALVLNASGAD